MSIPYLYDDGYPTGKERPFPEDRIIWDPRVGPGSIRGVFDGVSFYSPREGPRLFDGRTQGMNAGHLVAAKFEDAGSRADLENILVWANRALLREACKYGLSLEEPQHLFGGDIAVAKIGEETITLLSTGDCRAIWQMRDGSVGATPNQSLEYETWVEQTFASIRQKHGGDIVAAWDEWLPMRAEGLRKYQNQRVPGGFGMLNGDPVFVELALWVKVVLPRKEVLKVILMTDGFTTLEEGADPERFARRCFGLYENGGLGAILLATRKAQDGKLSNSHEVNLPEATAMRWVAGTE